MDIEIVRKFLRLLEARANWSCPSVELFGDGSGSIKSCGEPERGFDEFDGGLIGAMEEVLREEFPDQDISARIDALLCATD